MEFNGDNFKALRCWPVNNNWTRHLPFQFRNEWTYSSCSGGEIEEKEHVKDLGVMLSSDLTFSNHIKKVVKICRKQSGFIFRTFRTRSRETMMTLWTSMIQSRLDYCSQLYSPNNEGEIKLLEDVQRSFTSRIFGLGEKNYRERLQTLCGLGFNDSSWIWTWI